jgi:hypothetical protein
MGKLFDVLASAIRVLSPKMKTVWATEFVDEPCVFLCNHAGAMGPIDMCAKFPLRDKCYTWLNADMMDKKAVPAYVRQDYWWRPGCFMEPFYNATLPYLAAAILPPILKSGPGIPVYHDARGVKTFKMSLSHLKKGNYITIFPEQPSGYQSHHTWINDGFLNIAPLAFRTLNIALKFYPVHLDYKNHTFTVSAPIQFDINRTLDEQKDEMLDGIRKGIAAADC